MSKKGDMQNPQVHSYMQQQYGGGTQHPNMTSKLI